MHVGGLCELKTISGLGGIIFASGLADGQMAVSVENDAETPVTTSLRSLSQSHQFLSKELDRCLLIMPLTHRKVNA